MLDVEDSLAGDPIGIVLPGGRRRNGVPVFANERFIIRYVVGKSRDEEPREERNPQLPGAAVGIIPGRSIRYRRCRLNGGLQPFPLHTNQRNGSRSCGLRRRSGRIRKEEGRGKRPEYLLERLRFGPGGEQRTNLHPVAFGPALRIGIGGEVANDAIRTGKLRILRKLSGAGGTDADRQTKHQQKKTSLHIRNNW